VGTRSGAAENGEGPFVITDLRKQIRPLFFSPGVQSLVQRTNRVVSSFLFQSQAKDRLRELFTSLPDRYGKPLHAHLDAIFEVCLRGTNLGPQGYFELAQWLSGRGEGEETKRPRRKGKRAGLASRRLKILFVTSVFPSVRHGGGLRTFDIMRGLAKKHDVSLYTVYEPGDERELDHFGFLKSVRLSANSRTFLSGYESWISAQPADFDAIHFIWPESARLMSQSRKWARRLVFEYIESVTRSAAMSLIAEADKGHLSARTVHRLINAFRMETLGTKMADATIALVPDDHEFARRVFHSEKGVVIPTGISEFAIWERAQPESLPPQNRDALFVGFFTHTPNREGVRWYLENIHARVCEAVPSYRFIIAGTGATEEMRELVKGHERVVFEGPFDDVVEKVSSCRIGLAPLISGAGLRGKVNQYSAIGRPTVTTPIGASGLPYVNGESILITQEPDEFAANVIRLLKDETFYEAVRANAQAVAREHFSWDTHLPALETIYAG